MRILTELTFHVAMRTRLRVAPGGQQPGWSPARNAEPFGPGGAELLRIIGRCWATLVNFEMCFGQCALERIENRARVRKAFAKVSCLPVGYGDERVYTTARSKRARHGESEVALALEHCTKQRPPGQRDPHFVGATSGFGKRLPRITHEEQRVRQTTFVYRLGGTPRRLDQARRTGIHPDRQNFRARAGELRYGRTIAGAQIYDRPRIAADQLVELADVELAQVVASDDAHGTRIIAHWPLGYERRACAPDLVTSRTRTSQIACLPAGAWVFFAWSTCRSAAAATTGWGSMPRATSIG